MYRRTVIAAFQNVADTLHALEADAETLTRIGDRWNPLTVVVLNRRWPCLVQIRRQKITPSKRRFWWSKMRS